MQKEKKNKAVMAAKGHYGIIKRGGKQIGGFFNWNIGASKNEWVSSSRKWWLFESAHECICDIYFYKISDNIEILMAQEKLQIIYGDNTTNKLINSLITMKKEL